MKILVCAARQADCDAICSQIDGSHDVRGLCGSALETALRELVRAIAKLLRGEDMDSPRCVCEFADVDLALFDHDLTALYFGGPRLSAEAFIGYLRAFTDIAYIVSLNKNRDVDFDLCFLFGDCESQADLAINTDHLGSGRLWEGVADAAFAPWYWPCLDDAVTRRRRQVEFVRERLNEPVWASLAFPDMVADYMSRRARARLYPVRSQRPAHQTTFREFFHGTGILLQKDIPTLSRMTDRGDPAAIDAVCRVVAADIDRWLRCDVLGPQDVLIDVPHLLARMPYLLGARMRDLACFNAAIQEETEPFGMDADLYRQHVRGARYSADIWVPSPCYWWPMLREDQGLFELFLNSGRGPFAVFCEDASVFASDDADGERPAQALIESATSWPRRHLAKVPGRHYWPACRFIQESGSADVWASSE